MHLVRLFVVPMLALTCGFSSAGSAQLRGSRRRPLRIEIEQYGKKLQDKEGEFTLERAPFDIVVYLPDKEGVSVRAASKPYLYELAKTGAPLGEVFNPYQTSSESLFNADEDLVVDDATVQHYWWYDSADREHRFNQVTRFQDLYKCRRTVKKFWFFANTRTSRNRRCRLCIWCFSAASPRARRQSRIRELT